MAKLTYYTNYQDLKKSQKLMETQQHDLPADNEFKEFINLLTKHRISKEHSRINKGFNPSANGK
jgi:hypothetical protein